MQYIYKRLLKELSGYHKYLRCTDIWYNNFEVICSDISLDKVDLVFTETVKSKSTGNYSGFITYSNTIYFSGLWLDKCDYLIIQFKNLWGKSIPLGSRNWESKNGPQGRVNWWGNYFLTDQ